MNIFRNLGRVEDSTHHVEIDDAPVVAPTMVANLCSVTVCMSSSSEPVEGMCALGTAKAAPNVATDKVMATTKRPMVAIDWGLLLLSMSLEGGIAARACRKPQDCLVFLYLLADSDFGRGRKRLQSIIGWRTEDEVSR